ncbi:MAG TPA: glycogen synthase GlgA, partial [bacterium]|nr:glycogen synthase GlgA [bacterium]
THRGRVAVRLGAELVEGAVVEGALPGSGLPIWLIEQPRFFDRPGLYGEGGADYPDNLARFAFFCRAVLQALDASGWPADVIHCNDWQTALIPPILRAERAERPATVLTIHNLAYQGIFPAEQFTLTGLPGAFFTLHGLEFWGQVNLLKGGLYFADMLSTVSETYAREIQTPEFGAGLDGVLRDRAADLVGILNGVDYSVWDPAVDPFLPARYSADDLSGKAVCKRALQEAFGLPVRPAAPLIGMVTRLVDQKGLDLVAAVIDEVLDAGAQVVLLGTGEPKYHELFETLMARRPEAFGVRLGFDNALAHLIEAGADIFLMPSRYEPSGLNQLYSLRYGTVPVVRRTGGLADSIVDTTPQTVANGTANGFVFEAYDAAALLGALRRALDAYRDRELWRTLQRHGMRADFSWERAAERYRALYERALQRAARPTAARG